MLLSKHLIHFITPYQVGIFVPILQTTGGACGIVGNSLYKSTKLVPLPNTLLRRYGSHNELDF